MKNRPLNSRGGLVQIVYLTEIRSINDVGMLKLGKTTKRIMVNFTLGSEDFAFGILPNLELCRLGFALLFLAPLLIPPPPVPSPAESAAPAPDPF